MPASKMAVRHLRGKDAAKATVLALPILPCLGLTYYCHFMPGIDAVFTHLFYIPIVVAGFWWGRRGVWVGLFLAACLIATHILSGLKIPYTSSLLRSGSFIAASLVIGALREGNTKTRRTIQKVPGYLTSLIQRFNVPIIVWDEQGKIAFFNAASERLTGYTAHEVIGQELRMLFPEMTRGESLSKVADILRGEAHESLEIPILRKDGDIRVVLWSSANIYAEDGTTVLATVAQGQDITRRKQMEQSIQEAREYAESIVETVRESLVVLDSDLRVISANRSFYQTFRVTPEETEGQFLYDLGNRQWDIPKLRELLEQILPMNTELQNFEVEHDFQHIGHRVMLLNARRLHRRLEKRQMILLAIEDITERKRAEEEKEELQGQLRQAQKMEAVGQLAGGVAHDFNNILTVIQGYTEIALRSIPEDDPLCRNLNEIRKATMRAANLTRQLLLFSSRHPVDFAPVDLNKVVNDLIKMLSRLIGEDISLTTDLERGLWTVKADVGTIEQVIMNLAVNARDAMPEGGEITIKTENVHVTKKYCQTHRYARPGRFVCLSVRDTGVGMEQEVLEHIFEPFFTTKRPGQGTGMGLSVVYGIVKQHEGWVNVESSLGNGTIFRIYLPAVSLRPREEQKAPLSLETLRGEGERILLVEDEESVRQLCTKMLSQNGYTVSVATNGREALDIFRKEEGNFDLIFCDVVLPDVRGPTLAERLLKLKPGVNILFASGYSDRKSDWHSIRQGGYPYLQKPYSLPDLLKAVRETLKRG